MNRIIFICLLSLSACLSAQTPTQGQDPGNTAAVDVKQPITEALNASKNSSEPVSNVPAQTANVSAASPSTPVQNLPSSENIPAQQNSIPTTTITNDTTQSVGKADSNKTEPKLPETKESETKPTDGKNMTTDASKNSTSMETTGKGEKNSTVIDDKEKKGATTTKIEIVKPTEAPALQTRGFDGPSFIGGIILTLGLIAISFMGYKYYKNQTERNYYGTL